VIRRWLFPLLLALALAAGAYQLALAATPRLLMGAAMVRLDKGGVNRFTHAPLATDRSRVIVRPSPDLAYSSCPFDLSRDPVSIEIQPVPAPYWSLSVFDARTDVTFVRNNRDSGGKPVRIVLAREGQEVPTGVEVVRLGSDRGVALIRILIADRSDFPAVDAARRASDCGVLKISNLEE
jgi:uncharacterized membrane protein